MDFFEILKIPRAFFPDEQAIRKSYLALSRAMHPDHFSDVLASQQVVAEEMSGMVNQAFTTLRSFDSRVKYLLEINDAFPSEGNAQLPPMFLMEMMELNESIEDLDGDATRIKALQENIAELKQSALEQIKPMMQDYDAGNPINWSEVQEYYLKTKYYDRLEEQVKGIV